MVSCAFLEILIFFLAWKALSSYLDFIDFFMTRMNFGIFRALSKPSIWLFNSSFEALLFDSIDFSIKLVARIWNLKSFIVALISYPLSSKGFILESVPLNNYKRWVTLQIILAKGAKLRTFPTRMWLVRASDNLSNKENKFSNFLLKGLWNKMVV